MLKIRSIQKEREKNICTVLSIIECYLLNRFDPEYNAWSLLAVQSSTPSIRSMARLNASTRVVGLINSGVIKIATTELHKKADEIVKDFRLESWAEQSENYVQTL